MKRKIDVSVIVPIYNSEKYLENCLVSIQEQTLATIEVICVNDGSTDSSQDIIDFFCSTDVRFFCCEINHRGAGEARNVGLKYANGDYVCFLDSDDWFEKDMLENAYLLMKKEQLDVCVWGTLEYDNCSLLERKSHKHLRLDYVSQMGVFNGTRFDHIFNFTCGSTWNKLFSRTYLKSIGAKFLNTHIYNDIYFTYIALALAKRIDVIDAYYVHYRVNNTDSLQSKISENFNDLISNLCEIEKRLKKEWVYDYIVKRSYKNFVISILYSLLSDSNYQINDSDCSDYIRKSVFSDFFEIDLFDDNTDAYHFLLDYIDNKG